LCCSLPSLLCATLWESVILWSIWRWQFSDRQFLRRGKVSWRKPKTRISHYLSKVQSSSQVYSTIVRIEYTGWSVLLNLPHISSRVKWKRVIYLKSDLR
jgi:hypothetical protein